MFKVAQDSLRLFGQSFGAGVGDDPAARLDEKRIADDRPELVGEMADCRLGDAEPLRRGGDRAGLDDRDQEAEQPVAGALGLDVQDLGAAQTGMSKEAFKARLVAQNEQPATL